MWVPEYCFKTCENVSLSFKLLASRLTHNKNHIFNYKVSSCPFLSYKMHLSFHHIVTQIYLIRISVQGEEMMHFTYDFLHVKNYRSWPKMKVCQMKILNMQFVVKNGHYTYSSPQQSSQSYETAAVGGQNLGEQLPG